MENFTQQLFSILTTQPGNLVYHLILAFSVVAGLQAAIVARKNNPEVVARRMILGLFILLLPQLILFLSSGLAWQQVADPQRYQPPLDRAATAFSLVWIIWLWCFPKPSRSGDAVTVVLSLAVIVMGLFTYSSWTQADPGMAFNGTWYDWGWHIFSLAVTFLGLLILFIGRPPSWGIGLAVLGLILAGYVASLLMVRPEGYLSGIVRLAQLCAYPLLPVLAHRMVRPAQPEAPARVEERRGVEPRIVLTWMQAAAESDPQRLSATLGRAVGQGMLADMCFLIAAPDQRDRWVLMGGQDLVTDEELPLVAFPSENIPNLSAALLRGRSARLPQPGQTEPIDLKTLGEAFGLDDAGSLLAAPLINNGKVLGGVVMLSPYSNRDWTPDEQSQLMSIAEGMVPVLQRAATSAAPAVDTAMADDLRRENEMLLTEIANLRAAALLPVADSNLEALLAVQNEAQETIQRLQAELDTLRATKPDGAGSQFEAELRMALEENAYMRNDLAEARAQIEVFKHAARAGGGSDQGQLIAAITQNLRQPVNYLASYTDLLRAESAGVLDATQLGYLDRIQSSVDRMRAMLDDLTRAASLYNGARLRREAVDLSEVIDSAVNAASSLLREKSINFRIDLPNPLPAITANADALRQVLVDLLCNAFTVTPEGGTVTLRARVEENGAGPALLLQVKDSGGGIDAADVDRVFEPRTANGIHGIADGGYGLAVARALVEALHGKIWVESEAGKSATFHVKLPSEREALPDDAAKTA